MPISFIAVHIRVVEIVQKLILMQKTVCWKIIKSKILCRFDTLLDIYTVMHVQSSFFVKMIKIFNKHCILLTFGSFYPSSSQIRSVLTFKLLSCWIKKLIQVNNPNGLNLLVDFWNKVCLVIFLQIFGIKGAWRSSCRFLE